MKEVSYMENFRKELQTRNKQVRIEYEAHRNSDKCSHTHKCPICINFQKELEELNLAFNELDR